MHKRIAGLVALTAAITMAIGGSAAAAPILQIELGPAGAGYNSDGTFDSLADVVDAVCAEAGQHDLDGGEGLRASLCDERPTDASGQSQGSELLTADTRALPPVPGAPVSPTGFGSDGFFASLKAACSLGQLVGVPVEGQTVEVAPGVVVKVCQD